ncbi:MAG TPA: hypothetical protein VJW20_01955 [Candidatus Angelobacter sp.]|nr:hypothetical protein [Candidatus Angelobacter sp.]
MDALVRFCGTDRAPIGEPLWAGGSSPKFASLSPTITYISGGVWHAPIAYAGYLWLVSVAGTVYRVSPMSSQGSVVANLGTSFGRHAFALVPGAALAARFSASFPKGPDPKNEDHAVLMNRWAQSERILLAIVGDKEIALIDPAFPDQVRTSPAVPAGCMFVSADEGLAGVVAHQGRFATLQHLSAATALYVWDSNTNQHESISLTDSKICGPFLLGGDFTVYSQQSISYLANGKMVSNRFPLGFNAFIDSGDSETELPWGRPPYVAGGGGVYVPGIRNGRITMAWAHRNEAEVRFNYFDMEYNATYRDLGMGCLLLSEKKQLRIVRQGNVLPQPVVRDDQLLNLPATRISEVYAAVAQSGFSRRQVRLYSDGRQLVEIGDHQRPLDLFFFPGCLSMTYRNAAEQLEIASWPLE